MMRNGVNVHSQICEPPTDLVQTLLCNDQSATINHGLVQETTLFGFICHFSHSSTGCVLSKFQVFASDDHKSCSMAPSYWESNLRDHLEDQ